MSSYGPPGGPYPDPHDPWQDSDPAYADPGYRTYPPERSADGYPEPQEGYGELWGPQRSRSRPPTRW